MRAIRLASAIAFAALLITALAVTAADSAGLQQIVPGVWFRLGDLKQYGHCNNIIIEMKDYLVVIDANFPSGARLALESAKKVSSKPVKYVFDTHHHGDHAYGNPVWTRIGATTLAYVGVVEELKRYEPAGWQSAAKTRPDVAELKLATAEPPKQTFTKTPFVLDDGNRRIEFHFFGWAHTRGDGFAYLPKEKVICTGDAVLNGPYNFTSQGNIANWPEVVRKAQKLDVKHVLPGHGSPGGPEILEGQRQFFLALRAAVQAEIKKGRKMADSVTIENNSAKATTVRLPDSVKNWVGPGLAAQVRDAWEEIDQQKPHGEIAGGK